MKTLLVAAFAMLILCACTGSTKNDAHKCVDVNGIDPDTPSGV